MGWRSIIGYSATAKIVADSVSTAQVNALLAFPELGKAALNEWVNGSKVCPLVLKLKGGR